MPCRKKNGKKDKSQERGHTGQEEDEEEKDQRRQQQQQQARTDIYNTHLHTLTRTTHSLCLLLLLLLPSTQLTHYNAHENIKKPKAQWVDFFFYGSIIH